MDESRITSNCIIPPRRRSGLVDDCMHWVEQALIDAFSGVYYFSGHIPFRISCLRGGDFM